jgi:pimeloyl-ACP methyl ester carboxylesterase
MGWFRAPNGVLLDGASLGSGSTGVALAHESPGDLCGASFGGAASMVAGSRLGSRIAGVVSLSGEPDLGNRFGPDSELDAQAAIPKLKAPLLIVGSREDGYLSVAAARSLERRASSAYKRLALFPGGYHGWDLVGRATASGQAVS